MARSILFSELSELPRLKEGHLKKLDEGGLHPPYPRSAFIPVHRTGYSAGGFHKRAILRGRFFG
jgi:hypothetical protein